MNLFTQRRKRQRLTEEQRDEMKRMKKESTYERFIQKAREFGVGLIQDTEEKKVFKFVNYRYDYWFMSIVDIP